MEMANQAGHHFQQARVSLWPGGGDDLVCEGRAILWLLGYTVGFERHWRSRCHVGDHLAHVESTQREVKFRGQDVGMRRFRNKRRIQFKDSSRNGLRQVAAPSSCTCARDGNNEGTIGGHTASSYARHTGGPGWTDAQVPWGTDQNDGEGIDGRLPECARKTAELGSVPLRPPLSTTPVSTSARSRIMTAIVCHGNAGPRRHR
ncbi:hypothetical protein VTI74DRAFT_8949 [Chaetomium olivicolor]